VIDVGSFCLKSTEDPRPFCAGKIGIAFIPNTGVYFPNHASSQIVLLALEKHLKPGMTVLDIGTGTGVLAIAAEKLGASKVVATEHHPEVLEYASKMFKLNGCTKVQLVKGAFADEEFDLCLCNLDDKWVKENRKQINALKVIWTDDKSSKAIVNNDVIGVWEEEYELVNFPPKNPKSETIEKLLKGGLL
jgi:ribosomal protein L11 methylase PrmA